MRLAAEVPFCVRLRKSHILTTFADLKLSEPLLKALAAEGYETPTPIQEQAIPPLLAGRDLLGIAQTGTGKTAAFALPILERLSRHKDRVAKGTCRALILSPTRELAAQIAESFQAYGRNMKLTSAVVFGGVSLGRQIEQMRNGVDVLVATPGRLVDLIDRRAISIRQLEVFVLDEVDQMLDLGFIHAIRKLTAMLPRERQNLFFSATMPKEIAGLAEGLLKEPVRVSITPVATTAERVTQSVYHVDPANKTKLLVSLLENPQITRALIFTRTKHGADKVVKVLLAAKLHSAAIHGNKSQTNREKALAGFKSGKILALVATDIAARGIDVDGVSHVFNYDLPFVPESYVHRIGRTARAGATGEAIAFCTPEDRGLLRDIERTIRLQVPVLEHELALKVADLAPNFGWNPADGKRKSGGGRHMPNAAKKPHRGQPPHREANQGRKVQGDATPPPVQTRQPTDQVQVARAPRPEGDRPQSARPAGARPHSGPQSGKPKTGGQKFGGQKSGSGRPQKFGERKFSNGNQAPKRSGASGGGNWMKQVTAE